MGRAWGEALSPPPQVMPDIVHAGASLHTHTLQNLLGRYELQWISKWKTVLFVLIIVSVRPTHTHLTFLIYYLKVNAMRSGPQILPLLLD